MLDKKSDAADEATRSLGWIDDERVIPFFNKAIATDDYSLRFAQVFGPLTGCFAGSA